MDALRQIAICGEGGNGKSTTIVMDLARVHCGDEDLQLDDVIQIRYRLMFSRPSGPAAYTPGALESILFMIAKVVGWLPPRRSRRHRRRFRIERLFMRTVKRSALPCAAFCVAMLVAPASRAIAGSLPALAAGDEACIACHDSPIAVKALGDGGSLPLFVERESYAASVHATRRLRRLPHRRRPGRPPLRPPDRAPRELRRRTIGVMPHLPPRPEDRDRHGARGSRHARQDPALLGLPPPARDHPAQHVAQRGQRHPVLPLVPLRRNPGGVRRRRDQHPPRRGARQAGSRSTSTTSAPTATRASPRPITRCASSPADASTPSGWRRTAGPATPTSTGWRRGASTPRSLASPGAGRRSARTATARTR